MLPDEFDHLTLIPAHELAEGVNQIPTDPGVYLWFVRGGRSILEQSSYFTTKAEGPLLRIDAGDHLYTGAAQNLRFRLGQHIFNPIHENSSPRKSLVALERRFGAISKAVESIHDVEDDEGLTEWIFENVTFGIETHPDFFSREYEIIRRYASPFNIAHRRAHRYSKWLMAWRAEAFPPEWMQRLPQDDRRIRDAAKPKTLDRRSRRSSGNQQLPPRHVTGGARARRS